MTTTPFEERPDASPDDDTMADPGLDGSGVTKGAGSAATDADREDLMPEDTPFRSPDVAETD